MLKSEVSCVRYLIGRIVKTYDYINRVVLTLPLTVYEGTWTNTLPSRCYIITMILRVRRNFFEITTFPNRYAATPRGLPSLPFRPMLAQHFPGGFR